MSGATEMAITSQLDLTSFKAMGAAKSRRVTVNPENLSTFVSNASTTDVYFTLPSGKYSFINGQNSYLAFDVLVTLLPTFTGALTAGATNAFICNSSASSFIRTLEVQLQSQTTELLDKYDVFAAIIEDAQGVGRSNTISNVASGGATWTNSAIGSVPLNGVGSISNIHIKQGYDLWGGASTAFVSGTAVVGTSIRVAIPLYSSVLGTMQQQYMPAADGIRLRLAFQPSDIPIMVRSNLGVGTGSLSFAATYTVSNLALQMDYLDVVPEVYHQLVAESGGVLRQHGSACANFGSTLAALTTFSSILIPARYSSLKNLLTVFRNSVSTTSQQANSCGDRIYPLNNDYVYRIDGRNYPSVNVRCGASGSCLAGESIMEVIKCFHSLHSAQFDLVFGIAEYRSQYGAVAYTSPANAAGAGNWKIPVPGDCGTIVGSYVIGLEMEQDQAGKAVISGMDTNSSNTYLDMNYTTGNALPYIADTFAIYDLIIEYDTTSGVISFSK